jgi:hypothetical protein
MQLTRKIPMKIWNYFFGKIQYKKYNLHICHELKVFPFLLACSLATRSFSAFCVSVIIGTETIITSKMVA